MLRFARLYANTKRFLRRFAATPHPSRHSPCHLLLQEKALGTVRIGALNTNLKFRLDQCAYFLHCPHETGQFITQPLRFLTEETSHAILVPAVGVIQQGIN